MTRWIFRAGYWLGNRIRNPRPTAIALFLMARLFWEAVVHGANRLTVHDWDLQYLCGDDSLREFLTLSHENPHGPCRPVNIRGKGFEKALEVAKALSDFGLYTRIRPKYKHKPPRIEISWVDAVVNPPRPTN